MSGRILIIEGDEWSAAVLAKMLRDAGYEVELASSARDGFEQALKLEPDCIICDVTLPDIDGFWVARRIRTDAGPVSTTPFLFLTTVDDRDSRLQGLNVGADVYMVKPVVHEEVIAQVAALIDMAARLRQRRESLVSSPVNEPPAAFAGDISQMSIATLLTLLEMERRSGQLTVERNGESAVFDLSGGGMLRAVLGGEAREPVELMRTVMKWEDGRFSFRVGAAAGTPVRGSIGAMLLEAMRLEDEQDAKLDGRRGELARRRSQAPPRAKAKPPMPPRPPKPGDGSS